MGEPMDVPAGEGGEPAVELAGVRVPGPVEMAALLKAEEEAGPPWGLLDLSDGLWLGESKGPALFDDWTMAEVAAMVADTRLGRPVGITRPAHFHGGPLVKRDAKDAVCTAEEAVAFIESGLRFGLPPRDPPVAPDGNLPPGHHMEPEETP